MPAGLPSGTNSRLMREWQVQKVGDVGTVNVSVDMSAHGVGPLDMTKVKLLVKNSDSDFSTGVTISGITPTLSGTTVTFSGVSFNDGDYFTIALPYVARAPGGITTGLREWIRADRSIYTDVAGTTAATNGQNVKLIKDQSGNGNHITDHASGADPMLVLNDATGKNLNYQYQLQFCDSADSSPMFSPACAGDIDHMYDPDGIFGTGTYSDTAMFMVAAQEAQGGDGDAAFGETTASGGRYLNIVWWTDGNMYSDLGNTGTNRIAPSFDSTLNAADRTSYLWSEIGSTTNDGDGSAGQFVSKNGYKSSTDATFSTFTGNSSPFYLGATEAANAQFGGRISEIAIYAASAPLTTTQIQKIQTYYALKYGLTLSNFDDTSASPAIEEGAYVLSDGTVAWDGSIDAGTPGADRGFHYGVAGLARDDASDLYQKIGKAYSTDEMLAVALDNDFTTANSDSARVGSFASDLQAIMWGHNGGSHLFDTATSTTNTNTRLGRVWKMRFTGTGFTTKSVNIQFNNPDVLRLKNGQQYVLLESANADMSSATELATASAVSTAMTGSVTFTGVTITNAKYYSLATKMIAPGGVTTKLINGLRDNVYINNTWNDSFHSPTTWFGANTDSLNWFGSGTTFGAPIMTAYVDHIQTASTGGVTNGSWDDNYGEEFNGYINLASSGSNYIFKLYGLTTGAVDDVATMWIDKNGDGLLSDDEKIISVYGAVGTSVAQTLPAGNVRFRVRYKEITGSSYLRLTIQSSSAPVIAERELTSADYRVEAPLAMGLRVIAEPMMTTGQRKLIQQ
jgi:hypothetical protein